MLQYVFYFLLYRLLQGNIVLEDIGLQLYIVLFCAAFVAGFIDSIAGGGGMITIPALLLAGIPPHQALGVNKLQSCFGSFSATLHFYKKKHLTIKDNIVPIFCVFLCAICGTLLIRILNTDFLAKCIPFLLIIFAFYFLFSPKISEDQRAVRYGHTLLYAVLGCIGFYDGFFGPGTGSFLMLALIGLGGYGLKTALAHAKLFNFTSNVASMLVFALGGHILWLLGFIMGIGQFIGANIGSRLALRYGIKIIKPLVVCVSLIICIKLLYNQYF